MKKEMQKIIQFKNILLDKNNKSLTKQTLENSSYSFMTNLISKAGSLIFTIILARLILPELFGLYSLALSIILTIATFTDLGLSSTISKYLSESLARGKKGETEARSRLRFLLKIKLSLVFIVSLLIFLLAPIISTVVFHRVSLIMPLQIGAIYLFVMGLQSALSAVFYPLRKLKYTLYSEVIFQVLRIVLFVILIGIYKSVSNILISLVITMLASAVFYLFALIFINKHLLFGKIIPVERRKMTLFWGWTIILSSSLVLFGHIDTFMLGFFVEDSFIGYYSILLSLVASAAGFITFGGIFLPIFTQIKGEQLNRGFSKAIKYSAMLSIPAAVGLAFIILPLIRIIYGVDYAPLEFNFPMLVASVFLCLLVIEGPITAILNSLFMAKDRVKLPAILLIILTAINIVLNIAFIKIALPFGAQWALVGVSLATFLTRYLNLGILAYLSFKNFRLGLNKETFIMPAAAAVLMLVFLFLFNYIFKPAIIGSAIMIILAAAVYFINIYLLSSKWSQK